MPPIVNQVPSMLSYSERALLHWAAREGFGASGTLVDAGCFLGGSTLPLGLGLQRRVGDVDGERLRIHAFDLFKIGEERERVYFPADFPFQVGASIRELYEQNIALVKDRVVVHPGDINRLDAWHEDISVLFIDIAKSWNTNDTVVTRFFPHLTKGAVVIQQDLVHFGHPWCALTMELLSSHFEYLGYVPFSSAVYRLLSPIDRAELPTDLLNRLSPDEAVELIDNCAARIGPPYEGYVRLAAASLLVHHHSTSQAREIIAEVASTYSDETLPWLSDHIAILSQIVAGDEARS